MSTNFSVGSLEFWCQKVLPLVYDDSLSYYEFLGKVVSKLNEVIATNDALPDYIEQMIIEYFNSQGIDTLVEEKIGELIVNVLYPPNEITGADRTGAVDCTETFQQIIDYLGDNGGTIFVPSGLYTLGHVDINYKVNIIGNGCSSTKLILNSLTNDCMFNITDNCNIKGLTINGNYTKQTVNSNIIEINECICDFDVRFQSVYNGMYGEGNITLFGKVVYEDIINNNVWYGNLSKSNVEFFVNSEIISDTCFKVTGGEYNNVVCLFSTDNSEKVVSFTCDNSSLLTNGNILDTDLGSANKVTRNNNILYNPNNFIITCEDNFDVESTTINTDASGTNSVTGNVVNVKGSSTTVIGDSGNVNINGRNVVTTATNIISNTGATIALTATDDITISGENVIIDSVNPLTYKTPQLLENSNFKYVEFQDSNDNTYKVLVDNQNTFAIANAANVKYFGAVGDGVTDDSDAIISAFSSEYDSVLFPSGRYLCSELNITKNVVMCEGSYLLYGGEGEDTFLTIAKQNGEYNFNIDCNNMNPHYVIDVQSDSNIFNSVNIKNFRYNGSQSANSGVHVDSNNNMFNVITGLNLYQDSGVTIANDSCPQLVAIVNDANKNHFKNISNNNCRSTVVNASTNTYNSIDVINCMNSGDNGCYNVRGGVLQVGTILYDGDDECLVSITDSETIGGYKTSTNVGQLIIQKCFIALRVNDCDKVSVGSIQINESCSFVIFTNSYQEETNSINIGNILINGNVGSKFIFLPSERGSFNHLSIGKISGVIEYEAIDSGLGGYFDLSACNQVNIGDINLIFKDMLNTMSIGTRIYFLNNTYSSNSYIGKICVSFLDNTNNSLDILLRVTDIGQNYLKVTGGSLDSSNNYLDISNTTAMYNDNLSCTNPPSSGTWRFGQFIQNINTSNDVYGWRCSTAGTPGTWTAI